MNRFTTGCRCCTTLACCRCVAQPIYWSLTWPPTTCPAPLTCVVEGDYVLAMVHCSGNVNPELTIHHTRWESAEGFTYNGGADFQPWFVLRCGKPTEAEGGPDRRYLLQVFVYNGDFDTNQSGVSYWLTISDTPSAEDCLGPVDLPLTDDSFGLGAPDPLTVTYTVVP